MNTVLVAVSLSMAQLLPVGVLSTPIASDRNEVVTVQNLDEGPGVDFQDMPGYQEDVISLEVSPGQQPLALRWGGRTRDVWGSSYATSTEIAYLYYQGKARAAGNVHLNQRIVRVCIWYSRNSVNITPVVCSNASSSSGTWVSGPEVSVGAWDTLGWNDPKTVFNIQTVRISPTIY